MQKNSGNFSMEDAIRFANSPAGQKLLAMLQQSGNPSIQMAMEQASKGNMDGAKEALKAISDDPQIQKILGGQGG